MTRSAIRLTMVCGLALGALALTLPAVLFISLRLASRFDPTLASVPGHFVIVTSVSALALALAVAVTLAARSVPEPRTFALAMGFLSMAGLFFTHAIGAMPMETLPPAVISAAPTVTPAGPSGYGYRSGGGDQANAASAAEPSVAPAPEAGLRFTPTSLARMSLVGFSANLSLLVSAFFFALAVIEPSARLAALLLRRWPLAAGAVALALAGYFGVAIGLPQALTWLPLTSRTWQWSLLIITWALLAFAGWRFLQAYLVTALPLQGAMALGMGLLIEAGWFMSYGPLWRLSWWEYHVVMLLGFLAAVASLLWAWRRTGDLAVVVEGLFLRSRVSGLCRGDPDALVTLVAAVAAKDGETGAHVERVSELAVVIACRLGLSTERIEHVRLAGRLHDLGKIGVPNSILRKPGKLSEREFEVIKEHTVRGDLVAARSGALAALAPIIRAHHERMDGSGYPDGLAGEAIPLEARIIAVADVWDSVTADRPYRRAMPFDRAVAVLCAESGSKLDTRCVAALFAELDTRHTNDAVQTPFALAPAA